MTICCMYMQCNESYFPPSFTFNIVLIKENNWFPLVFLTLASVCYLSFINSDHVPVGGFCSLDKQCTGSNYSETCKDRRCQCSDGHLLLDLECIQGRFF